MKEFKPGERVLESGIYCAYHSSHRLMHKAALLANDLFPYCKQCREKVRFTLLQRLKSFMVVPFRSGEILEEFPKPVLGKLAAWK